MISYPSEVRHGFDDDIVPEEKASKEKKEPENEEDDSAFLRSESRATNTPQYSILPKKRGFDIGANVLMNRLRALKCLCGLSSRPEDGIEAAGMFTKNHNYDRTSICRQEFITHSPQLL